jgi:hypothetical protein
MLCVVLNDGVGVMEYTGNVVEMGDLSETDRGLVIEIRPQVFLEIIGFARHDLKEMPNFLYKKLRFQLMLLKTPNAKLNGRTNDD